MTDRISRRQAVAGLVGGGATTMLFARSSAAEAERPKLKGRVNHSVCRWCYRKIPLETLCTAAKAMGIASIDLLGPDDWPTARKHGLTCAMVSVSGATIPWGFNRTEHHDKLVAIYEAIIPKAADAGLKNVICFSGNREGLDDEAGIKNCAAGLKRLMPLAKRKKITLVMELLNSKVNHKDYQCDHTAWGVELCKQIGSERFKLLYDIYHMQIMEGDLISTIQENAPYIAHYHTGGVPGRAEIDRTQEINYPAVVRAIVGTGYQGFIAQEFIPRRPDPLKSLREAVAICDV